MKFIHLLMSHTCTSQHSRMVTFGSSSALTLSATPMRRRVSRACCCCFSVSFSRCSRLLFQNHYCYCPNNHIYITGRAAWNFRLEFVRLHAWIKPFLKVESYFMALHLEWAVTIVNYGVFITNIWMPCELAVWSISLHVDSAFVLKIFSVAWGFLWP